MSTTDCENCVDLRRVLSERLYKGCQGDDSGSDRISEIQ